MLLSAWGSYRPFPGRLWLSPLAGWALVAAPPPFHPLRGALSSSLSFLLLLVCFLPSLPEVPVEGRASCSFLCPDLAWCVRTRDQNSSCLHTGGSSTLFTPAAALLSVDCASSLNAPKQKHHLTHGTCAFLLGASRGRAGVGECEIRAPPAIYARSRTIQDSAITGCQWWFGLVLTIELRASGECLVIRRK